VYHCWTESKTYDLDQVSATLGQPFDAPLIVKPPPLAKPRRLVSSTDFEYTYPDGIPSHVVVRKEYDDGSKECPVRSPDGSWKRPSSIHPFYDESRLQPNLVIVVVEGENKVQYINAMQEEYQHSPVVGFTTGSSNSLKSHSPDIAMRLQQLDPAAVLLWPDNDDPGITAMRSVRAALSNMGIQAQVVDPLRYNLGPSQDVVDHIQRGDSVARVLSDYWPTIKAQQNGHATSKQRIDQLVTETVMLSPGSFVFPGTQNSTRLENGPLQALWHNRYNSLPAGSALTELKARMAVKGQMFSVEKAYQCFATQDSFYWRPTPKDPIYHVDADGMTLANDVPGVVLLNSCIRPRYTARVDNGVEADYLEFCELFGLSEPERLMVLTWLISALTGRKAPILLLKGGAATGKTTLASILCAVVDPDTPTISVDAAPKDRREFVRTVQVHPVLLLDNVSSMPSAFEDVLSKIVTGESTEMRTLYEDTVETVRLQRAVAVTTTTWDVSKGDLATRIWPIEPRLRGNFFDEDDMEAMANRFLPKLRGYVFERCSTFYRQAHSLTDQSSFLRIGGRVVQALGYSDAELSHYIRDARARVLVEGDPWLDYVVGLWEEIKEAGPYRWQASDIAAYIADHTRERVEPRALGLYLRSQEAHFPDYGFHVQRNRVRTGTEYKFEAVK
jgi:hypothetical protein